MKTYYFDYNATTPVFDEVIEAMRPFWQEQFANPSSFYQFARKPAKTIKEARAHMAALLCAENESEIVFTSGGTESNNTAFRSVLAATGKKEIITSKVEHSSVLKLARQLAKEGYIVHELGVDKDGDIDLAELRSKLNDNTALVSLMWANNETGVLFPVRHIASILKDKGVLFHIDAVQAAGKIPISMQKVHAHYISLSAHKIYGPKGVGVLYVRTGAPYQSLIYGGSQERGRRAGTENLTGVAGLGKAAEIIKQKMDIEPERVTGLRDYFEYKVQAQIPDIFINGVETERLGNTSSIGLKGIKNESLLIRLDQNNICVSAGSACMSGAQDPSHVLKAMGLSDEEALSCVRFSFGFMTQKEDVDILIDQLKAAVEGLRGK